ncbi:MAG TPA: SDR family NAD(P)-dependent oxidoreductase, partial [Solirubrobacteraceae bacterium]|nr:SDR family NAD(P)-dependent oxidoreductase [Solirubrobacteraceae bacterium]
MGQPLSGKVAVVTGASSGIGLAIAHEVHRLGATVVIAARSRERLAGAAASGGERCTAVVGDVTRGEDVERLVGGTIEAHG